MALDRWIQQRLNQFPELAQLESDAERRELLRVVTSQLVRSTLYWVVVVVTIAVLMPLGFFLVLRVAHIPTGPGYGGIIGGVVGLLAVLLTGILMRTRQSTLLRRELNRRGVPVCIRCGYGLRGVGAPRCPECGAAFGA